MPRHVDWEIQIHLDTVSGANLGHKDDYFKAIEDRYTSKYCDQLGVEPLPCHKAVVAREAALRDCEFDTTWSDNSAVASKIAIRQPTLSVAKESTIGKDAANDAEWYGQATYQSITPPDGPTEVAAHLDLATQSKAKAQSAQRHMRMHAFASMQLQDALNSAKADEFSQLSEELEQTRLRVRSELEDASGKADVFGRLMKKKVKREADEKEMDCLRAKFLLPFACERSGNFNLLPWHSPELRYKAEIKVHDDFMAEAKRPITLTMAKIEQEVCNYAVTRFPVELMTTRADPELFAAIREQLVTDEAVRITGLVAHFLYWIVLGHIHPTEKRLPEASKQSLLLTIQELWSLIQAPARQGLGRRGELLSKDGPAGISFVLPAFMLSIKRGVEWAFQVSYPFIFAEQATATQLIDQINLLFMRLFDPDCLYASFGAVQASEKAIKLWHKLNVMNASLGITPARRIINQEFRITPLMSLLMTSDGGNPGDPKTRILLAKSASDSMIGSPEPNKQPEKIPLDGWRRAVLYRSANKRLTGLQRAGLETTSAKKSDMKPEINEKTKRAFTRSLRSPSKASRSAALIGSSEMTSTVGSESNSTPNALSLFSS